MPGVSLVAGKKHGDQIMPFCDTLKDECTVCCVPQELS